eukprot:2900176-Amphidinium_carterae.1
MKRLGSLGRKPAHHRFYSTQRLVDKYCKTEGCAGCVTVGKHYGECSRDKMLKRILADPEERLDTNGAWRSLSMRAK